MGQYWATNKYNYLIASGGGIKGLAYCGALHKLNPPPMKGYAGTSVAALIMSLFAIGYTPDELMKIFEDINIDKINDGGQHYITIIYELYHQWGNIDGDYLYEFLGEIIAKKTGNKDFTINDLYDSRRITLAIMTTNLNHQRGEVFIALTNGDIPIRLAVRMSISIPGVFAPVKYKDCYYVDGAMTKNYPDNIFPPSETLGLHIFCNDDQELIDGKRSLPINTFGDYLWANINAALLSRDMERTYLCQTIRIVVPSYPLNQFKLSSEQSEELFKIGEEAVSALV